MSIRCVIVDDEDLARERVRRLLGRAEGFSVTGEHEDAAAALPALIEDPPDLLFLDVHMPEVDGFGLLAALPGGVAPHVIFVTAHDDHAVLAFERDALDYLLKPFSAARFMDALRRARQRIGAGERQRRLAVRSADGIRLIRTDEIDWIAAADNYAELHTGGRSFLTREPLQALEARLGPGFARVHRGAIVNLDRVRELHPLAAGDQLAVLDGGARVRVSRTYRARLCRHLGIYDGE